MKRYIFSDRHIGPRKSEINSLLKSIGVNSVEELIDETVPSHIRLLSELDLPKSLSEHRFIEHILKVKKVCVFIFI